jgi:Protein of unknown function (DUF1559)
VRLVEVLETLIVPKFTIRKMLLMIASAAALFALDLRPARREMSGLRAMCSSNLLNVAFALERYRSDKNAFPYGTLPGSSPRIEDRLSFYLLITPYLDCMELYDQTNQAQAWNSPPNLEIARARIGILNCPLSPWRAPTVPQQTNYIGIAGLGVDAPLLPTTDKRAGVFGFDRRTTLDDIKDGVRHTMMLAETGRVIGSWLQGGPTTVRGLDPANKPYFGPERQFGGLHNYGACIAMADGSVRWLSGSVDPKVFEAMSTIAGGEKLPANLRE